MGASKNRDRRSAQQVAARIRRLQRRERHLEMLDGHDQRKGPLVRGGRSVPRRALVDGTDLDAS